MTTDNSSSRFNFCNENYTDTAALENIRTSLSVCKFMPLLVVAGTFRNDLFVTLVTAELDKDMKKTLKNLEVRLVVVDSHGDELQVAERNAADHDLLDLFLSSLSFTLLIHAVHYNQF